MSQNNNPKVWEINGISLPLDLEDVEVMERYEKAFDTMADAEKTIRIDGRASGRIRAYCMLYRNLFDNLFGAGTADKIFAGKPMSAAMHEEAYASLLDFVKAQTAAATERRNTLLKKYQPNRAQKRAAEKKIRKTK